MQSRIVGNTIDRGRSRAGGDNVRKGENCTECTILEKQNKNVSCEYEKYWMDHLKEDMSVFGMKFEGWRKAAQKAGRWFRRVVEGAELFMRNWNETERRKAAERRAKAAAASSTVGISKRSGGGGRGGGGEGTRGRGEGEREEGWRGGRGSVMPKRPKTGFGHHRIESCGPSNGRHRKA